MSDIDPATAFRTLTQRATAMRGEAEAARKQSVAEAKEDDQRFGLRRDALDRERGALARDAELADGQVKLFEEQRQLMIDTAGKIEIESGKFDESALKRAVEEGRAAADELAERAAAARADAAATRERLAGVDRQLVELDNEVRVAGEENQAARMAIFALDDQAKSVGEAARRYGEAAAAGDNIPERAAKELAAEQALEFAGSRVVDRDAIRRVIPSFPEQTPGLAEHPWPPQTPVIGPEETLDPFAVDAAAATGGDSAVTSTDQAAFADPFDGSSDDGSVGAGNDGAMSQREAAQTGDEAHTPDEDSVLGTYSASFETMAAGSQEPTDDAATTDTTSGYEDDAATPDTGGGYEDDAAATDTTGGYDEYAAATDTTGGYEDFSATNGTGGYDDYAAASDSTGGYDEYAAATDSSDMGYDGSVG